MQSDDVRQHVSFSKVDPITLLQVNIKSGPLFFLPENRLVIEQLGSREVDGKVLSMGVLKELIQLVRDHVSVMVSARESLPAIRLIFFFY